MKGRKERRQIFSSSRTNPSTSFTKRFQYEKKERIYKRRKTSPRIKNGKDELQTPFEGLIKNVIEPFMNLNNLISDFLIERKKKRISTCLVLLDEARKHSEQAKTPLSKKLRSDSYLRLGAFGMALFSPLDIMLDTNEIPLNKLASVQKNSFSSLPTLPRIDSFMSILSIDTIKSGLQNLFAMKQDDDSASSVSSEVSKQIEVKLYPESISELKSCPHILTLNQMNRLNDEAVPLMYQTRTWKRLFSLSRDGDSFATFLSKLHGEKTTLLVIRTDKNMLLGGYTECPWERQKGLDGRTFYGGGQSFLFRIQELSTKRNSRDNNDNDEKSHDYSYEGVESALEDDLMERERLNVYKWTGMNSYNQLICVNSSRIAMGGGGISGSFGLCIEDYFSKGSSGACDTYGNPPLASPDNEESLDECFEIVEMDVYGFIYSW